MLAVASPGPDFTLILRQSLRFGRATAQRSAMGIGCGIFVHVTYAVLGLGFVFRNSATAFEVLSWGGDLPDLAGLAFNPFARNRSRRSTGNQGICGTGGFMAAGLFDQRAQPESSAVFHHVIFGDGKPGDFEVVAGNLRSVDGGVDRAVVHYFGEGVYASGVATGLCADEWVDRPGAGTGLLGICA